MSLLKRFSILLAVVVLVACSQQEAPEPADPATPAVAPVTATEAPEPDEADDVLFADVQPAHVVIKEAYVSASTPQDNVDSPAHWVSPSGEAWVIATAKKSDQLMVYAGDTGELLRRVGRKGKDLGEFRRPNGIFVIDNLVFVVERDNHRVQVLRLPDFAPLGSFGEAELRQPYGLWVRATESGYEVRVSDAFMEGDDDNEVVPALEKLNERFERFQVSLGEQGFRAEPAGSFGATDAAGAIRIPESIWGDVVRDRLLLSEEDQADGTRIKVYGMDGQYRGQDMGKELFKAQAEGIALFACPDGSGYWLATDQFKDRSVFHVFDRDSLWHIGAFVGDVVANTDGVWLSQTPTARFPAGAFFAVHDDQGIAAFDWRDIATALKLNETCPAAAQ